MKSPLVLLFLFGLLLTSCQSKPSLEKYFVENTENKNFIQFDISPSILNIDKTTLSSDQANALKSFEKINVLAFKLNSQNKAQFETERTQVTAILKDEKYQQLMKFGSGKEIASVSYVGDDEHISEFILYGNKNENGFVVARVLGKNMNPTAIITLVSALKNSKINLEDLKPLQELLKNK